MNFKLDSYCGIYCGACEIMRVFRFGDVKKAAKEWDMKPEEIRCYGCKTNDVSSYSKDCDFKKCAEDKGVNFCFECENFPCQKLLDFENDECSHHTGVLKNLEFIKKSGLKNWLMQQELRWKCANCGTNFSWYEKTCKKCGKLLFNCISEEYNLNASN